MYAFFVRPNSPGNPPLPAQDCTALYYCFRLKSGKGSKAAKRLGDFADRMRAQAISKPRVRVHYPLFL